MQNYNFGIIGYDQLGQIHLFYYIVFSMNLNSHRFQCITFTSYDAQSICTLIMLHKKVCYSMTLSHGLYLARELTKAEFALVLDQEYLQD